MIEFAWPWVFALAPLPVLAYWLLPRARHEDAALHVPFYDLATARESDTSAAEGKPTLRRVLMILIWLALLLAAARPQWIGEPIELPTSGRDLMLAVDISGSMGTEDMELTGRQLALITLLTRRQAN
ncbi:MAG: BatB protein, partial [Pseudomonadales bacterium]|nr:BatB protein [Pseudomonadales bacterium]